MKQEKPSEIMRLRSKYEIFKNQWLHCDEFEEADDLALDFFLELEEYLGYPFPGN